MSAALSRTRSFGVLIGAVLLLVALAPRPALGCSCLEPSDLGAMIDEAPAAFVGTMVGRQPGKDPEFEAIFHFQVEQWVKSDLGDTVDVHSGSNGAMCGFEQPTGERVGLLLYFDGQHLTSGLCSMVSPDVLIEVGAQHVGRPGAVPPLVPEEVGLTEGGSTYEGNTTAQVALVFLIVGAVAAGVVHRVRSTAARDV